MKKFTIALLCMIMATGAAMAQKQFTFGPKIGVDYTHLWGKDADHGGLINYQAGLFLEYRFSNQFSIAPEVVFAVQGVKNDFLYTSNSESFDAEYTDNRNYINIPVMLKYYVTPELSIDLGPQLGITVYHKCTIKGKDAHKDFTYKYDTDTKSIDFGIGLGLTYNITKDVFVQGRYTLGLTNVFNEYDEKNGNAQLAIGYRF